MIVTLDYETTYDQKEYSLSKMSEVEYLLDPRYETIMCAVKLGSRPTRVFVGHDKVKQALDLIPWDRVALLAHNTRFDGAILAWKYGHIPKLYLDTLSMARATTHWSLGRSSLGKVSEYLGLPPKGDEVVRASGKRLRDFAPDELAAYQAYCARDNDNCHAIFEILRSRFSATELSLIDLVLRMFILPQVKLDPRVLSTHLDEVQAEKARIMAEVEANVDKSVFSSNVKFADLLASYGVEIPMKTSPTTGREIPALAKNDWLFKELCVDDSQPLAVQALLAARMSSKSTLEETRTRNLLRLSQLRWPVQGTGWATVPLKYSGARTHRLSGDGGTNWQNFKRGSTIRGAIYAPPGYRIVHRDASQIEARMVAWLARCEPLMSAFRDNRDVYCEFASQVYGRPITRADAKERFVGKTCVAAGTRVLTSRGIVSIEDVIATDMLWDGVEWVRHDGMIAHGLRETLTLSGVSLTPDHCVWFGNRWREASAAGLSGRFHPSVIEAGSSSLPDMFFDLDAAASSRSWSSAIAAVPSTLSIDQTSKRLGARGVTRALSWPVRVSVTGFTRKLCQTTRTALACLTGWLRQLLVATVRLAGSISTTGFAVSACGTSGAPTEPPFFGTFRPCQDGITLRLKWIASTTTAITSQEICASSVGQEMQPTSAGSRISKPGCANSKPVYDLLNAGPRHRFTILSNDGPVIVANSILGLGYGCGAAKFRHMLFIGNGGDSYKIELEEATRIVRSYRATYVEVTELWNSMTLVIEQIIHTQDLLGIVRRATHSGLAASLPIKPDNQSILLPNGMKMVYPNIRHYRSGDKIEVCYDDPYGLTQKLYPAKCLENVSQALARIIVTDIAVRTKHETGYVPFLSTHDSLDLVVPEADARAIDSYLEYLFEQTPGWAAGLPLASEGGWGVTLADAEKGVNQ